MNTSAVTTVLIVEDDLKLNAAYERLLESAGHHVASMYNGREALDYIRAHGDPDVILLDMRMPVMDGLEFLREYRPLDHPRTAVVVFSEQDTRSQVDEAYSLGITHYVLKARANSGTLLKIISSSLASRA